MTIKTRWSDVAFSAEEYQNYVRVIMANQAFITAREQKILTASFIVGGVGLLAGLMFASPRAWAGVLLNAFYFLTLALGAMVFLSIYHVSNAGWSAVIRRIPEAMMNYLPLGAMAMLTVFFGRHTLYEWTHFSSAEASAGLHLKLTFLNTPFFFARMLVALALWTVFAWLMVRESHRQDEDRLPAHTTRSKKLSAIFLAVFAITFSLASFDWLMSLEAEFYSTIYAFYCFSGLFLSGIAAITVLAIVLHRRGVLPQLNADHLHNLGKLVFGFSTFWAYIWLSQYLLIYYANIPEETIYYIRRTQTGGWKFFFLLNLFLNWVLPFALLISRRAKRSETLLLWVCAIILVGHWLDLYVMIYPALGLSSLPGYVDLTLLIGFAALFVWAFVEGLKKAALLPKHDPYLAESLALHSDETEEEPVAWDASAYRALALSTIGFAVSFAAWGLMGALAPRFRELYNLTPVQTAILIAVPVLLGSIGRLPLGILADKYGGRKVFGLLLCFCLFPAIGASFSNSYASLIGWGLLLGFAGTSFSVGVSFTSKWFPAHQQGIALGVYGMGNIGQSIAVFGAPALVAATGNWRVPFWIFGALAGLFGLVFLALARNAAVPSQPKKFGEYFAILKREPIAWVLSLFYFLTFGGFVALSLYLPTLLKDIFGLTMTDAGARVAGFVIVATAMRPFGGGLADKYGGARVLFFVLAGITLLSLGLLSSNMLVFTIGVLGCAAMLGAGNGAVFKLVPEYFPRETGTITGLVGAAGGLGGFFPPLVLGVIRGQTGSYTLGFIFLSVFALLCLAMNYFIFLRHRGEPYEAATA
ncbi:MAG: MFS transporter [Acidobacteriota bacterium]